MTYSFQEMRGALLYAKLIDALIEGGTQPDLVEHTGLSTHTVRRYLKALKEFKRVYTDHWQEDSRGTPTLKYWKLCLKPTKDAAKPRKSAEYRRKYQREWRAAKRKRESTSAFTQHIPRYAEGSRIPQPLRKQA